MNTHAIVNRDERTLAVENAGYRWAYAFVVYALLVDVVYRGIVFQEAAWDLMALVILSGAVCVGYQARKKAMVKGWAMKAVLVACLGAAIAAIVALTHAM